MIDATFVLDFDDFSPRNSNFGLLEDLKEHYPGFKVTLFMVPWEIRWGEQTPITEEKFAPFVEAVRRSADWLEVAIHGFTHAPKEFESISYEDAKKRIMLAEKMLINRGIKYAKLFKAPQWLLSEGGAKAVTELGFKVVEDGGYNWNFKDDMPPLVPGVSNFVWGHGHIQNEMGNGLEEVMPKLLKIPQGAKFEWLSEHLGVERINSPKLLEDQKKILSAKGSDKDAK